MAVSLIRTGVPTESRLVRDVESGPGQEVCREAESDRRVVVAAGQDNGCASVDEPGDGVGEQLHRVGRWECPVVDVA